MAPAEEELDEVFAALSDPTRRAILARLTHGEATVNELAAQFPISQQSVSRHIGVLRRSGLIRQRTDGSRRPCRVDGDTVDRAIGWLGEQRRQWRDRIDALEVHLDAIERGTG